MPTDCLAVTGASPLLWICAGVGVLVIGIVARRGSRVLSASLILVASLAACVSVDATQQPASAICSPDATSLVQGSIRVLSGTLRATEVPTLTASNGAQVLTAMWGAPSADGSDVVIPFAFHGIRSGEWTFEITESDATAFEFSHSDISFVVNSSRMLTGGPFNASTPSMVSVSTSGLQFEIAVTRS